MIYHLVAGQDSAAPLIEAIRMEISMAGEVVVLEDHLGCGPLYKVAGQSFSEMRSEWWNTLLPNEKNQHKVQDMERVLEVSSILFKDELAEAWIWMAPKTKDICMYHWLLFYMSKHMGRCKLINLSNLPFLDSEGKVFYPSALSEILPKELIKARRLAQAITPAEIEIDGEDWQKLKENDSGLRIQVGGKKLKSVTVDYYDELLLGLSTKQHQKASRMVDQALQKHKADAGERFLASRIKGLVEQGLLQCKNTLDRPYKDWDIKLQGAIVEDANDENVLKEIAK